MTILVAQKFLPYPTTGDQVNPPSVDNVFHCPAGVLEESRIAAISTGLPTNRRDAQGAMGYLHQSVAPRGLQPGLNVFSWYGINGSSDPNSTSIAHRRVQRVAAGTRGKRKVTAVRSSSELVFIFDGILGLNHQSTNANRLNARHNGQKTTNVAFLDGHAESFPTKSLPGGDGNANPAGTTFGLTNLRNFAYPKWRIDQP